MSEKSTNENGRNVADIVRLKVDGASSSVNTLRDQQTARGLSLVCPFPALEVEIPASFGESGGGSMSRGTIHRIGVEDDPETGLPRLRLSVRAHETSAGARAPEAVAGDESPDERAETDLDLPRSVDGSSEISLDEVWEDIESTGDASGVLEADEPAWVACRDLLLPEEIAARGRTRRRRRAGTAIAWVAVLAVTAGGAVALCESGAVSASDIRAAIAGFDLDLSASVEEPAVSKSAPVSASRVDYEPEPEPVDPAPVSDISEPADPEPVDIPISEPAPIPSPATLVPASVSVEAGVDPVADVGEDEGGSGEAASGSGDGPPEDGDEGEAKAGGGLIHKIQSDADVTLLLPTRWPAEYVSAYRLRDPNGVVVDIPGGLVEREGWLQIDDAHPMIRSVKAIQKETGARFVVFLHGDLPRYMTTPRTGGVALRLYREGEDEPTSAGQVAVLSR